MSFLTGIEIRKELSAGNISITSLINEFPFDPQKQVTEDSIDIRLFPKALQIKKTSKQIDILNDILDEHYEEVLISPTEGYLLKPNHILFGQTLEAISLPEYYVGHVFTRTTYAQLGIMITCGAPKMSCGLSWAFALQITNCNSIPIKIYPFVAVGHLMISKMIGVPTGYPQSGKLMKQFSPTPPRIKDREKSFLKEITAETLNRTEHIENKIKEIAKATDEFTKAQFYKKQRQPSNINSASIKILKFIFYCLSAGLVSYSVNLYSTDQSNLDQKTYTLIIFSFVLGVVLGLIAVFIKVGNKEEE